MMKMSFKEEKRKERGWIGLDWIGLNVLVKIINK